MCYRNCCAVFRACCRNWEGSAHRCPSPVSPSCAGAVWQLLQTLMIFSISVVVSLVGAPTHPPTALWEASATPALIRGWGRPAAHGSSVFGRWKQNYRDFSLIWRCSTSWSQPLASYEGSEKAAMCCGAEGSAGVTPAGRWGAAGVLWVLSRGAQRSWADLSPWKDAEDGQGGLLSCTLPFFVRKDDRICQRWRHLAGF